MAIARIKKDDTVIVTSGTSAGKTGVVEYQGARRAGSGVVAGGSVAFSFTARETAAMSLGVYPVRVWIEGPGGVVTTAHNAKVRICVSDNPDDVHGGGAIYLDVIGSLHDIEGLPARYTDEDLKAKVDEIIRRLGGTVAALLVCALPALGAGVTVLTAPKGAIYNDQPVVTNIIADIPEVDMSAVTNIAQEAATAAQERAASDAKANTTAATNALSAALTAAIPTDNAQLANGAGYVTKAVTNGLLKTESDPTVPAWAKAASAPLPPDYATVSNKAMSALQDYIETDPYVPAWAREATKPTYTTNEISGLSAALNGKLDKTGGTITGDVEVVGRFVVTTPEMDDQITIRDFAGTPGIQVSHRGSYQFPGKAGLQTFAMLSDLEGVQADLTDATNYTDAVAAEIRDDIPNVPTWARQSTKPTYTASEVGAYSASDGSSLEGIVNAWEGYWGGTNVIFEVTNYFGNTSGEAPRLRVKEFRDGSWRTVWDEDDKFHICETNLMTNVVGFVTGEVNDLKEYAQTNYAPMAWGAVTDKGNPNPVTNTVWMTSPETYFAGGTEYQRVAVGSGSICVLVDNGALTKTAGEPGTFRFQDDGGTNYFGFAKSDSYTIGCRTDGITVNGNLVTLRYDVIMAGTDVPIVYWRLSLTEGSWVQLNNSDGTATQDAPYTVTWYQSGGSYYAAINCGMNPSGFFRAETEVAGEVVFETNMKIRADGGIECRNTANSKIGVIRPTYNGSAVNWTWSEN